MEGSWDIPNIDCEPGKSKWLAKGKLEETAHIRDLNCHTGASQGLSFWVCLSTHTVFFLLLINTCFTAFCLCGNSFLQSQRARALSLTTGLVARIWCFHRCDPASISGWEARPCSKLLQAEATGDHHQKKKNSVLWSLWGKGKRGPGTSLLLELNFNSAYCLTTTLFTVQFSSVTQSCLTLCDPMDCGMSGLPGHHQLLEFT